MARRGATRAGAGAPGIVAVTSVDTDYDNLTTTLVADFDAPIDEVWELWADPRKLERWWGPPVRGRPARN